MSITDTQWRPEHAVEHKHCFTLLLHRLEAVMLVVAVEQHLRRSRSTRSNLKAGGRTKLPVESRSM